MDLAGFLPPQLGAEPWPGFFVEGLEGLYRLEGLRALGEVRILGP